MPEELPPLDLARRGESDPLIGRILKPYKGDIRLDGSGRNVVRVLVSYNNTNYFLVGGAQKGLEYELMRKFEEFLNAGPVPASEKSLIIFISVPFDQLIPSLLEGYGDIAAAGLTITEARAEQVAFTRPYRTGIAEIVVRHKDAPALSGVEDLSGKTVHVLAGSSYHDHLAQLNAAWAGSDRAPIDIQTSDRSMQSEDLLQMVNAGVFPYMVVDSHIAELWSSVLPDIVLQPEVSLREGRAIAWAVRPSSPNLLAKLNEFVAEHKQGTLLGNIFFKRYYQDTKWVDNPLTPAARAKLNNYVEYFKRYGEMYDIPWLKLAALAYQESGIKQDLVSSAGAVGIMQIKPSTAGDRNVAIDGVTESAEANIHAGTKYLAFLRDRYFADSGLDPAVQLDFTFASYNAGPARVRRLRQAAAEAGLDPNEWFFNVEHIARREIGRETVDYVANINKYYVAFSSIASTLTQKESTQ